MTWEAGWVVNIINNMYSKLVTIFIPKWGFSDLWTFGLQGFVLKRVYCSDLTEYETNYSWKLIIDGSTNKKIKSSTKKMPRYFKAHTSLS